MAKKNKPIPPPPELPVGPDAIVTCDCFLTYCKHRSDPNHWTNRYRKKD